MSKHRIVKIVFALLLSLPYSVVAQDSTSADPYHIFGVVWRGETEVEDGFREYLNQSGIPYKMTIRNLDLDRANAPPIIEEIRQENPDLVYTWGTGTTSTILGKVQTDTPEKHIRDIPGIFVLVAYPQSAKLVESYESPGRNVTGVAFLASIESQLSAIQAYHPFKTIAVIYDSTSSNSRINVASLEETAPKMGLKLIVLPVPLNDDGKSDPESLPDLINEAKSGGAELIYMGPDSFVTRHGDRFTALAIEAGLPTFASTQAPLLNSRAMFGLVTDYHTLGKLAAVQAENILVNKIAPEQLPVRRLARLKLWINIDVVKEIGLYPPMSMIAIAFFSTSKGS